MDLLLQKEARAEQKVKRVKPTPRLEHKLNINNLEQNELFFPDLVATATQPEAQEGTVHNATGKGLAYDFGQGGQDDEAEPSATWTNLAAIAAKWVLAYDSPQQKKKRKRKKDDYDLTDDFIDDSEGNSINLQVRPKLGGFFVSSGDLETTKASDDEMSDTDDSLVMTQDRPAAQTSSQLVAGKLQKPKKAANHQIKKRKLSKDDSICHSQHKKAGGDGGAQQPKLKKRKKNVGEQAPVSAHGHGEKAPTTTTAAEANAKKVLTNATDDQGKKKPKKSKPAKGEAKQKKPKDPGAENQGKKKPKKPKSTKDEAKQTKLEGPKVQPSATVQPQVDSQDEKITGESTSSTPPTSGRASKAEISKEPPALEPEVEQLVQDAVVKAKEICTPDTKRIPADLSPMLQQLATKYTTVESTQQEGIRLRMSKDFPLKFKPESWRKRFFKMVNDKKKQFEDEAAAECLKQLQQELEILLPSLEEEFKKQQQAHETELKAYQEQRKAWTSAQKAAKADAKEQISMEGGAAASGGDQATNKPGDSKGDSTTASNDPAGVSASKPMQPKLKFEFPWTDSLVSKLRKMVQHKEASIQAQTQATKAQPTPKDATHRELLKQYLKEDVLVLWPKGMMSLKELQTVIRPRKQKSTSAKRRYSTVKDQPSQGKLSQSNKGNLQAMESTDAGTEGQHPVSVISKSANDSNLSKTLNDKPAGTAGADEAQAEHPDQCVAELAQESHHAASSGSDGVETAAATAAPKVQ